MEHYTAGIQRLFRDVLNIEVPATDTDVIEAGLLDSLALVELLAAIEQEFQVELPLDGLEIETFRSVDTIAAFVASMNGRGTSAT
jgi:acyl carrier protein